MASQKPSIVLVHGAYHSPISYKALISVLEDAGYPVSAPHLPSSQDIPAILSIEPDVAAVCTAVVNELDAGRNVIMVLHSYGGIVGGTCLRGLGQTDREAEGKTTAVKAIVCIAANLIEEGEVMSSYELVDKDVTDQVTERAMNDADGYLRVTKEQAKAMWCNRQSEDAATEAAKLVKLWAMGVLQSLVTYAAWKHIPTTYIYPTEDRSMLPAIFERVLKLKKEDGTAALEIIRCKGGDHSIFLDRPEWVAKIIRKVAGEGVGP